MSKRLVTKEAVIYHVRGKQAKRTFSRESATFFDLSAYDGVQWALLRSLDANGIGQEFSLLRSTDGGQSWQETGPIPGHANQALATGTAEGWVLGVDSLLHSADGGKSWTPVEAPGERNAIEEKLVIIDERHVAIIGDNGVMLIDRESATYKRRILQGVSVQAADGRLIVAREKKRQRIGVLDESLNEVRWLGTINKNVHPFDVSVSGKRMWLLALPQDDSLPLPGGTGRGVHLFTSKDGGRSWSGSRVRSGAWYDDVDIGPDGAGIGVGYENEVWLANP